MFKRKRVEKSESKVKKMLELEVFIRDIGAFRLHRESLLWKRAGDSYFEFYKWYFMRGSRYYSISHTSGVAVFRRDHIQHFSIRTVEVKQ